MGNVALAGGDALVVQEGERTLRVRRVPLDGGPSQDALTVRLPADKIPTGQITASGSLAGLVMHTETPSSSLGDTQVFRGQASERLAALGPLRAVPRRGFFAGLANVDGERLFVTEFRADLRAARHLVLEAGHASRRIRVPATELRTDFAGDLVASSQTLASGAFRLVLREWRTGRQRSATTLPAEIETFDLAADGSVVVAVAGGDIIEIRPGRRLRRVARSGAFPVYAGQRIAYVQRPEIGSTIGDRIAIIEPGGTTRALSSPFPASIDELAADERHALWVSGGCAYAASVSRGVGRRPDRCTRR